MEKEGLDQLIAPGVTVMGPEALARLISVAEGTPAPVARVAKAAAEFGEDNTTFLWYPYLPRGDYSVLMAEGDTGKTLFACKVAAAVSSGAPLPEDDTERSPENVLIISGEDSGEVLTKRLAASGAVLSRVFILDREDSVGLDLSNKYDEFAATIKKNHPALVIIDPWHAFLGAEVNINRINALRPILQKLANLAKECDCAMILISHVNKKAQTDNANNAAVGSSDFINASRSAFRVIFDDNDGAIRIFVHTKANYAPYGVSLRYKINNSGGVDWAGTSPITMSPTCGSDHRTMRSTSPVCSVGSILGPVTSPTLTDTTHPTSSSHGHAFPSAHSHQLLLMNFLSLLTVSPRLILYHICT